MSESICLKCGHKSICATGVHQPSENVTVIGCSRFEQKKPQTNADRIRSMTDEELAKKISGIEQFALTVDGAWPPEQWLDWLKQEAKE